MSEEIKTLDEDVVIDYAWNPGPVVGRFLAGLRDEAEIQAIRCTKTSKVFMPPQSWSPYGQIKMDGFVPITSQPEFFAGTIVYKKPWNAPEGIETPYMLGAIKFAEADTELLHVIKAPEEKLKALKKGDKLNIVWTEEREGRMRDMNYFEPAE